MKLNDYQTTARETAIYGDSILSMILEGKPDWVENEDTGGPHVFQSMRILYVQAGLMEEVCELITHVDEGPSVEGITKELGDAAWYTAAWCTEWNIELQAAFKVGIAPPLNIPGSRLLTRLIKQARHFAGISKRLLRDKKGVIDEDGRNEAAVAAGGVLRTLMALADFYEVGWEKVLSTNVEKLHSRQERGKLTGKGDER